MLEKSLRVVLRTAEEEVERARFERNTADAAFDRAGEEGRVAEWLVAEAQRDAAAAVLDVRREAAERIAEIYRRVKEGEL